MKSLIEEFIKNWYENGTDKEAVDYKETGYYADFSIDKDENLNCYNLLKAIITAKRDEDVSEYIMSLFDHYSEEIFDNVVVERFDYDWDEILEHLKKSFTKIVSQIEKKGQADLFRVIKANSTEDICREKPGNHWVDDYENLEACAYWCSDMKGSYFCLRSVAKKEDINWRRSIWSNFYDGDGINEINTVPSFKGIAEVWAADFD